MNQERWTAVDQYITDLFVPAEAALDTALRESRRGGLAGDQCYAEPG